MLTPRIDSPNFRALISWCTFVESEIPPPHTPAHRGRTVELIPSFWPHYLTLYDLIQQSNSGSKVDSDMAPRFQDGWRNHIITSSYFFGNGKFILLEFQDSNHPLLLRISWRTYILWPRSTRGWGLVSLLVGHGQSVPKGRDGDGGVPWPSFSPYLAHKKGEKFPK